MFKGDCGQLCGNNVKTKCLLDLVGSMEVFVDFDNGNFLLKIKQWIKFIMFLKFSS